MISIGEGSIDIPSHWHNASVNIFSSNPEGGSGKSLPLLAGTPLRTVLAPFNAHGSSRYQGTY